MPLKQKKISSSLHVVTVDSGSLFPDHNAVTYIFVLVNL